LIRFGSSTQSLQKKKYSFFKNIKSSCERRKKAQNVFWEKWVNENIPNN
jgi:hypothetical protein